MTGKDGRAATATFRPARQRWAGLRAADLAGRVWMRAALLAARPFGPPDPRDRGTLDDGVGALLRLARSAPQPASIAALRAAFERGARMTGLLPDRRVQVGDGVLAGRPARRYVPPGGGRGALLYLHGGGFVMGSLDTHDAFCRATAAGADLRVVALDYRLAPENPFPAAVDDALAAWWELRAQEDGPLAVGGDSAGANLAAVVSREYRQVPAREGPCLQWLLHPVVDVSGEDDYPSAQRYASGYLLTLDALHQCGNHYIPAGQDRRDPRLSPVLAPLEGAAPAVVVAAGFDPVRDQAPLYRDALRAAGVPVRFRMEEGLVHGFELFAGVVPEARRAARRAIGLLREGFDEAAAHRPPGRAAA